jgi:hypothetical protein|tara:strand:- start:2282 stop:2482 length:201 start_codon:yes stop_codon:yes gene_type:complete
MISRIAAAVACGLATPVMRPLGPGRLPQDPVKGDNVVEAYETEDDAIQSYSGNVSKVERNILFGFK